MQHVLPGLHGRCAVLALPRLPQRPPSNPGLLLDPYCSLASVEYRIGQLKIHFYRTCVADKEVVVPRRDQGERDSEGAGHLRRADVHHQQCEGRLHQRAAAAEAGEGRHQHL